MEYNYGDLPTKKPVYVHVSWQKGAMKPQTRAYPRLAAVNLTKTFQKSYKKYVQILFSFNNIKKGKQA